MLVLLTSTEAQARRYGIATEGCAACHGDAGGASVRVTADPASFAPGTLVTLTASVERAGIGVGGLYVVTPAIGRLQTLAGEGLTSVVGGLTHSAPKAQQGGAASFRFQWQAPSTPGALRLTVHALAGNGDGRSTGDAAAAGAFSFVFGCTAQTFYFDGDGDGHGSMVFAPIQACAGEAPVGYSATVDDCDDGRDTVHPGAKELCNDRDDTCDGRVDEDARPEPLFPDPDRDGFYAEGAGPSVVGCLPLAGYALEPGDCDGADPNRSPEAVEVCNQVDDDCDGRVDEQLRPQCGEGWCRRVSVTCSVDDCVPGVPRSETCNGIDDDCDEIVDNPGTCSGDTGAGGLPGSAGSAGGAGVGGAGATIGGGTARGGSGPGSAPNAGAGAAGAVSGGGRPATGGGSSENGGAGGNRAAGSGGVAGGPDGGAPPRGESSSCAVAAVRTLSTRWLSALWVVGLVGVLRRRTRTSRRGMTWLSRVARPRRR